MRRAESRWSPWRRTKPSRIPNQFGVPAGTAINQAGDFAFVGKENNALFFRAAGTSSASIILQAGDPVPGFPGSVVRSFSSTIDVNSTKVLLFVASFSLPDGLPHAVLLTFDGTNFRSLVSSGEVAPGSGGATYGASITPGSIDDNGDVDFAAIPTANSALTYYIVPSGGLAVRVASLSDLPPAACTWCSTGSAGFLLPASAIGTTTQINCPGMHNPSLD